MIYCFHRILEEFVEADIGFSYLVYDLFAALLFFAGIIIVGGLVVVLRVIHEENLDLEC